MELTNLAKHFDTNLSFYWIQLLVFLTITDKSASAQNTAVALHLRGDPKKISNSGNVCNLPKAKTIQGQQLMVGRLG